MEYKEGTKVFQDWEIVRFIGEGASGKVYEIQKKKSGITVKSALKVIQIPHSVADVESAMYEGMDEKSVTSYFRGFVDEIINEVAVMSELKSHANIVSYEDHCEIPHEGSIGWDVLIRMELLTPVQKYMMSTQVTESEVIRLGKEMCQALVFCQKKGLIHRDIKLENIFANEAGQFKLGDFGIARTVEKTTGGLSKKGTESYMAPEVYLGKPYGASVDIYSVGLVLYGIMNNNRLPFLPPVPQPISYKDRENALGNRMQGKPIPKPAMASDEFSRVILKACAYNPAERYHTAEEMLYSLNALTGTENRTMQNDSFQSTVFSSCEEEKTVGMENIVDSTYEKTVGLDDYAPQYEKKEVKNPSSTAVSSDDKKLEKNKNNKSIGAIVGIAAVAVLIVAVLFTQVGNKSQDNKEVSKASVTEEATELYDAAKKYFDAGEYELVISYMNENIQDINSDLDLKSLYDNAVEKYSEQEINIAYEYMNNNEYEAAITTLEKASDILGANNNLEAEMALNDCENAFREYVISEADTAFTSDGYEAAIAKIDSGLEVLNSDELLLEEKNKYEQLAPVYLKDLMAYEGDLRFAEQVQDNMGNTYQNCFIGYPDGEQATYDIGAKYNVLTATVAVTKAEVNTALFSNGYATIKIYGDDKVLYEDTLLDTSTKPHEIKVEITGVTDLRVELEGKDTNLNYYDGLYVIFADVMLQCTSK